MSVPVTFHLSLNVRDLRRSVEFYRTFFDRPPAKQHDDYAKFEIDDPPVIFSLAPHAPGPGSTLSHVGFRVGDDATIERYRERLEAAGICTQAQVGTVCGYAKQNKLWVKDPDGNFWEIYHIEEDVNPIAVRKTVDGAVARIEAPPVEAAAAWEHFVTNPFPDRIPHSDASLDEVRLVGTYNSGLTDEQCEILIRDAARVLKPGGRVLVHGLMADRPFPNGTPKLPGLAAMVSSVPVQTKPLEALVRCGFTGAQIVKYTEKPWFVHDGAELREVKMTAFKPLEGTGERTLLYKGPFANVAVNGTVLARGKRVAVPEPLWRQLRDGSAADQFVFAVPPSEMGVGSACTGG